jgi:SAM-dependent methyltransferase
MGFKITSNMMTFFNKLKEFCGYLEKLKYVREDSIKPVEPANFRALEASPEALQRDLEYSLSGGHIYLGILAGEFLRGKTVLEIGPGVNFGLPLILACHGAKVMVADRFLTPWDPDYHPKFYGLLRDSMKNHWALIDQTPLDRVLSQGEYPPESICLCSCSLEELSVVSDQSVDVVISNAVLEHLYDLKLAFTHLARITKPGGIGIHQVDFRDHRDFSRPLEHLLLGDEEFFPEFNQSQGECGNRYRPLEMKQFLELAGFEVRIFQPNMLAEEEYFTEFLGRLRQASSSRYREYPAEHLRPISGLFSAVRKHT